MEPRRIGLFLVPEFALASVSAVVEVLRMANRVAARTIYSWTLLSTDGSPAASSSGITVGPCATISECDDFAMVFVVSSRETLGYADPRVVAWLRRLAAHGCALGGVGCGAFVLARAGLLDGYRCTTHWQQIDRLKAEFPRAEVTADLYCLDRDRFTSGGALAALDLMLAILSRQDGADLAVGAADMLLHARIRAPADQQRMSVRWRYGVHDRRLIRVIALMEQHTDSPLSLATLAHRAAISLRQMERLFDQRFGCAPQEFYLRLRLRRAQAMLTHTDEAVGRIAAQCGFSSSSHLSRFYRRVFNATPAATRRRQRALAVQH